MLIAGGYLEIAKVNVGVIKNIQIVQEGYFQRLSQIVKYRHLKCYLLAIGQIADVSLSATSVAVCHTLDAELIIAHFLTTL